jgi:hypothetical protein
MVVDYVAAFASWQYQPEFFQYCIQAVVAKETTACIMLVAYRYAVWIRTSECFTNPVELQALSLIVTML